MTKQHVTFFPSNGGLFRQYPGHPTYRITGYTRKGHGIDDELEVKLEHQTLVRLITKTGERAATLVFLADGRLGYKHDECMAGAYEFAPIMHPELPVGRSREPSRAQREFEACFPSLALPLQKARYGALQAQKKVANDQLDQVGKEKFLDSDEKYHRHLIRATATRKAMDEYLAHDLSHGEKSLCHFYICEGFGMLEGSEFQIVGMWGKTLARVAAILETGDIADHNSSSSQRATLTRRARVLMNKARQRRRSETRGTDIHSVAYLTEILCGLRILDLGNPGTTAHEAYQTMLGWFARDLRPFHVHRPQISA